MKKLLTCLLFFALFKNVISATNAGCYVYNKATGITLIRSAEFNLLDGEKMQTDIHPLEIFDLRFN